MTKYQVELYVLWKDKTWTTFCVEVEAGPNPMSEVLAAFARSKLHDIFADDENLETIGGLYSYSKKED